MANNHSLRNIQKGISQGLLAEYYRERALPDQLKTLLERFRRADAIKATSSIRQTHSAKSDRKGLNRYLKRLGEYLPGWLCRAVKWLRQPHRVMARSLAALLLIVGGLLSFLPILGIWMLPLGLIIISQDLPFLQRPLVRTFAWIERQYHSWRERFRGRPKGAR